MNLIPFLTNVVTSYWKMALAFVAGAALCAPLAYCEGKKAERHAWEAVSAKAVAASLQIQRAADTTRTAAERVAQARIATNRQEIDNALASIPDRATSPRQHARACIELRRQASSSPAIDAACGPAQPAR